MSVRGTCGVVALWLGVGCVKPIAAPHSSIDKSTRSSLSVGPLVYVGSSEAAGARLHRLRVQVRYAIRGGAVVLRNAKGEIASPLVWSTPAWSDEATKAAGLPMVEGRFKRPLSLGTSTLGDAGKAATDIYAVELREEPGVVVPSGVTLTLYIVREGGQVDSTSTTLL